MARSTSVWVLKKCNSQNRRKDMFFVAAVTVSSSYFCGCFAESLKFCSWLFEMHEELVHKHERKPFNFWVGKF